MTTTNVPPNNLEAERSVLGSILSKSDLFGEIAGILEPEDFYSPTHVKIYEAMLDLSDLGEPIDFVMVLERGKSKGRIFSAADLAAMADEAFPSSPLVKHHAKLVREASQKRRILSLIREAKDGLFSGQDIASILQNLTSGAARFEANGKGTVADRLVLVNLSEVKREKVEWVWTSRIPRGKLTLIEGDPGVGKSWLSLAIAAPLTRGLALQGDQPRPPGNVLILTAEDGLADTVMPRLEDMEADLSKVDVLQAVKDKKGHQRGVTLKDIEMLENALALTKPMLAIVDPLVAYLGGVNEWKAGEVRSILAPLADLAGKHHAGMVLIRHLTKGAAKTIYRGQGSIDFLAACRAAFLVGQDPGDESASVLCHTKASLGPKSASLKFRIDEGRFYWEGDSELTADQVAAPAIEPGNKTEVSEASEFLKEILSDGPVASKEIAKQAKQAGIAERTLWRAKSALGVKADKKGPDGSWQWFIKSANPATED